CGFGGEGRLFRPIDHVVGAPGAALRQAAGFCVLFSPQGESRMKFRLVVWAIAALAVPVTAMAQSRDTKPVSYREMAAAYEAQSSEIEQLRVRLASLEEQVLSPIPEAVYVDQGMPMSGHGYCGDGSCGDA